MLRFAIGCEVVSVLLLYISVLQPRSVPEEYKPMIFADGQPQPFPAATRKIKRPAPAKRR